MGYDAGLHLYAYVGNDPANNTDPTGLCFENTCPVNAPTERASQLTGAAEAAVGEKVGRGLYVGLALAIPGPEDMALAGVFGASAKVFVQSSRLRRVLARTMSGSKTKGRSRIREFGVSPGKRPDTVANREFDKLRPDEVKEIGKGRGGFKRRTGSLPNGLNVTVRGSKSGEVTIEIIKSRPGSKIRTRTKIRFKCDSEGKCKR